jgi:hypothetical protein
MRWRVPPEITSTLRPRRAPSRPDQPTADQLRSCLSPDVAALISRTLGESTAAPERLAALLADADRVVAALAALPGPSLVLLELLCEVPDQCLPYALCRREVDRRLGRPGQGEVAFAALSKTGLLLTPAAATRDEQRWALMPGALAAALRPHVLGLGATPVDAAAVTVTRPGDATSVDLAVALLCGALERDPPKITNDAWLYKAAVDKLARIFYPADQPPARRLTTALRTARRLGLVQLMPGAVRVRRDAIEQVATDAAARCRAARLADARAALDPDAQLLFDRLLAAPVGAWTRRTDLLSLATVSRHGMPRAYWHSGMTHSAHESEWRDDSARQVLTELFHCAAVEVGRLPDGAEVARIAPGLREPPPAAASGRAYVQPSFEVILPPDIDFAAAVDIARIAEIRRVEDVATLTLSAASVAQARRAGLTAAEILAIPERLAPGAVPQNVSATLAEWARVPEPARLFETAVLVCADPGVAARVREAAAVRALLGGELAPGVFAVHWEDLREVHHALRAARIDAVTAAAPRGARDESYDLADDTDGGLEPLPPAAALQPAPALLREVEDVRAGRKVWSATTAPDAGRSRTERPAAAPRPATPPTSTPRSLLDELADESEDEDEQPYDYAALGWYRSPTTAALKVLIDTMAEQAVAGAFELLGPGGAIVRRTIAVDHVAFRRGRHFVEGYCYDTGEDVTLSLDSIVRLGMPQSVGPLLDQLLPTVPGAAPERKVGRNEPCPCGSGRKYKRCCGR